MYFENEALNDVDRLLGSARSPEALIARYQQPSGDQDPNDLVAVWDVILPEI